MNNHINVSNYRLYCVFTPISEEDKLIISSITILIIMMRTMTVMIVPYAIISPYNFQALFNLLSHLCLTIPSAAGRARYPHSQDTDEECGNQRR